MQGRCIEEDDHLDCYNDVSVYMRSECAGRRSCAVRVRTLAGMVTSCSNSLSYYLHADYDCVDGETLNPSLPSPLPPGLEGQEVRNQDSEFWCGFRPGFRGVKPGL